MFTNLYTLTDSADEDIAPFCVVNVTEYVALKPLLALYGLHPGK
jgi:hypothetical protein